MWKILQDEKLKKRCQKIRRCEPSIQNIEKYRADSLLPFLVIQEFVEKFDI